MSLDTDPSTKKGYLVYKGTDEGNFSDSIEYINYKIYLSKL